MLNIIKIVVSIFLIVIIFFQIPQDTVGLASFTTKSNLLDSPSSGQRFLNILTIFGIFVYFSIALTLNLTS